MKYSNGNSSTLFCEQVSTVTSLFEKWNDCERTVVMYALLKRLRYPNLKFLLYSIESNLTQNFGSQNNLTTIDINANNPGYLQSLITAYKSISIVETNSLPDNDSILYGSDIVLHQENDKKYIKKEEILNDVLSMLPLLRPGNDEAKTIYLSLIPLAVEDTVRQIVTTELVQQIFSYLLIHPAISNEDRRSLSHWLRHLEDHIQSSFASSGHQSFYVLSSPADSGSKSTSVSSLSSASRNTNTWQAIAPPSQSIHKQQQQQQQQQNNIKINASTDEWNINLLKIPDTLCTGDLQQVQINDTVSSQNSLALIYDNATGLIGNNRQTNEDHHVSFSKNGTEIYDFGSNICDKCQGHIGYSSVLLGNSCDHHLSVPKWNLDNKHNFTTTTNSLNSSAMNASIVSAIKTRRSNSLTTAISSSSSSTSSVITVNENCSNSSENLAQYAQKPRSYSLSIDNPRSGLTSSGSDTHLDDLKPNYLKFSTHNIGMSNIGQWLKSLRLHKYVGLFTNTTYEEMLEITEEYLQSLGVTKGASHKLALCIEKLKERFSYLIHIEQDLLSNQITVNAAIEELTNIVLTPMKPVDSTPNNVAGKFLQVLDLVSQTVAKKEVLLSQDEDCVNALLWILERSIHNEAFVAHTNQLKEHKFKLSKLKMHFAPKSHHIKNGNNSNLNKPRWNGKTRKSDSSKCGSNDRINRKNSNDTLSFSISSMQQQQQQQTTIVNNNPQQYSLDIIDKFHCTKMSSSPQSQQTQQIYNGNISSASNSSNIAACPQYKSSSYPNFSNSSVKITNQCQLMQHHQQQQLQQQQHQQSQQYRHHRHSLSNLIIVPTTAASQPQQQQLQQAQQIIFKIPKQPISGGGSGVGCLSLNNKTCTNNTGTLCSITGNSMTVDCKNRRSSLSVSTTTAVPSSNSSSSSSSLSLVATAGTITGSLNHQNGSKLMVEQINEKPAQQLSSSIVAVTTAVGASVSGKSVSMVSSLISSNNCSHNIISNNSNNNNSSSSNSSSNNIMSNINNGGSVPIISSSSSSSISNSSSSSGKENNVLKSSIGDINSSLEFLCLQMTEQAIN